MVIKHIERRVRLSDSHIKKLRAKDKLFSVGDSEVPGLRIYVETSGTKNFYYCYKPKNEKNWVRMLMDYIDIFLIKLIKTISFNCLSNFFHQLLIKKYII